MLSNTLWKLPTIFPNAYFLHGRSQAGLSFGVIIRTNPLELPKAIFFGSRVLYILKIWGSVCISSWTLPWLIIASFFSKGSCQSSHYWLTSKVTMALWNEGLILSHHDTFAHLQCTSQASFPDAPSSGISLHSNLIFQGKRNKSKPVLSLYSAFFKIY